MTKVPWEIVEREQMRERRNISWYKLIRWVVLWQIIMLLANIAAYFYILDATLSEGFWIGLRACCWYTPSLLLLIGLLEWFQAGRIGFIRGMGKLYAYEADEYVRKRLGHE